MSSLSIDQMLPLLGNTEYKPTVQDASTSFASLLSAQLAANTTENTGLGGGVSLASMLSNMASLIGSVDGESDLKGALMMFCMMVSSGASGSSLGAAMSSLSAALSSVSGGTFENLRYDMLASGYDRPVLERVNDTFFSNSTAEAITPFSASKAVTPAIASSQGSRSPALYRSVIDQFDVKNNPRYAVNKNGNNDTYCNIFLWDVTRAMNAEIPHYVDPATLEARSYPNVSGAKELNANGIYDWLAQKGASYGWVQVSPEQAQMYANQGKPVVTAWKNTSGGHGHVQVVCPSSDGRYDPERGVTIAQAGRRLMNYAPITDVYNDSLSSVVYYAHA